jgi:hypothetical protein
MDFNWDLNALKFLIHLYEEKKISEATFLEYHIKFSQFQVEALAKEQGIIQEKKSTNLMIQDIR